MKRLLQILIPILAVVLGGGLMFFFIYTAPEPRQRPNFSNTPDVVVRSLEPESYAVMLDSQGTVQARTTSTLIPEVRGRINRISPNFREGAFFEEGDVLLEIDPSDYNTELVVAEANLAQAQLRFAEEKERADQAKLDWDRLNPGQQAGSLTLREPQLKQAEANLASAQARVNAANRNLERTQIKAPYAGRILSKNVDVGQYVSPGNQLARVYAVDFAEVRLPLTATQFAYLDLPSVYRGENPTFREGPLVTLSSQVAGQSYSWRGRIVRAEGSVDTRSRQIFVVAQVRNPYGRDPNFPDRPPLKVGAYVEAEIQGKTLEGVFVVPRKLLRENDFLLMVDNENYLERKSVQLAWQTDDVIVVNGGVSAGERLCLTEVPFALEGWPVNPSDEVPMLAEADTQSTSAPETPRARPPRAAGGGGSGPGAFIARILEAVPEDKPLPSELKTKIDEALESGDRTAIRPLMGEVRAWFDENGLEFPGRGGGPRPRG